MIPYCNDAGFLEKGYFHFSMALSGYINDEIEKRKAPGGWPDGKINQRTYPDQARTPF
jgi:hypothetical protein